MNLPSVGEVFRSRYRLDEYLGEGGFATVYRALDMSLDRVVAVKVLRPGASGYGPSMHSRFLREAKVIANLSDPHTVTMFDFGRTDDGLLFMVFEHLEGRDLSEFLFEVNRLPEAATVHILRQLLMSLGEAHAAGIIHRDIKPENIRVFEFMGDPLSVKLLDFGIAKPMSRAEASITHTGGMVGTPRYMSPEHLLGEDLTATSDLYSLGLVAYEMLMSREALIEGNNPTERLRRLADGPPLKLPSAAPVGPVVRGVVDRLLQIDAGKRFQSAEDVLSAMAAPPAPGPARLDDLGLRRTAPLPAAHPTGVATLDGTPPPVSRSQLPGPPTSVPGPAPGEADLSEPPETGSTRIPLPWFVAAAAVLLAVGVGIATHQEGSEEPIPQRELPREVPALVVDEPVETNELVGVIAGLASRKLNAVATSAGRVVAACERDPAAIRVDRSTPWLHLPAGYRAGRPYPAVIMLHDDDQGAEQFVKQSGFQKFADEHDLVLIAPQDEFGLSRQAWDDAGDIGNIIRAIRDARERVCLDPSRILAVGHAAGGRAVERLACEFALAAMATTASRRPPWDEVCTPVHPVPYIQLVGVQDKFSPIEGGTGCNVLAPATKRSLAAKEEIWRAANVCAETGRRVTAKGGSCFEWQECAAPLVSCKVDGGREWPNAGIPGWAHGHLADCVGPNNTFPFTETIGTFLLANSK